VAAHRSGKRALVTKFSAHKVSLLDINGDKVSYSRRRRADGRAKAP
jgi:hypothetical protein